MDTPHKREAPPAGTGRASTRNNNFGDDGLTCKHKHKKRQANPAYARAIAAAEFGRVGAFHPPAWAGFRDRNPRTSPRRADGGWRRST